MQILTVLIIGIGLFVLQFVENFFLALLNFRVSFLFFLFGYRKVDRRWLLVVTVVSSIIFDVTMHYRLGTNLVLFLLPSLVLWLFSILFSEESLIGLHVSNFVASLLFCIANILLPDFLEKGVFGFLDWKMVIVCIVKALVATLLLFLIEVLFGRFRDRGNASQIRLK